MKAVPQGPLDGHAPQAARTRRIEAVVLSSDDGLIIDLGPVLGERYRTHPVDSLDELLAAPAEGERLVLLDAVHRPDAAAEAARLESQSPGAPIIAIVATGTEAQWAASLARGSIAAVVARERIGESVMHQALANAETRLRAQSSPTLPLRVMRPPPARPRRWLLPAALLVALLAAAGAWYALRSTGGAPATTGSATGAAGDARNAAATPAAAPAPARSALELLSAARVAFSAQRQLPRADGELKGDSALELYVQALGVDARSEEARDGVHRLFGIARPRIQAAIAAGRFDEAARLLELFRASGLEGEAVTAFEGEIAAARPRWLVTAVQDAITAGDIPAAEQALAQLATSGADTASLQPLQQALEARRQDVQLAEMATAVHAAIGAGNLLEPLADNARTRVQAMRQVNRTHAATLAAQHEYAAALLARAQEAARAQQFDAAQRYLAAATDVAGPDELAAGKAQLQAEIDAASQRAAQAARPAAPAATAAASAAPAIISAHATRPLSVTYPPEALQQKLTGYVVVEFMLHADGRAHDARVVESEPAGVFDKPALAGVAGGRFDVSALGPDRKPQRARLRLSFK
ncbi:MAG: energy transducer TonB [Steroidobacteraceae bacterium]